MAEEKKKTKKTTRKVGYADEPDLSAGPSVSERAPLSQGLRESLAFVEGLSNRGVAMTAIVLSTVFVVFVFVYDDFRVSPFVQGIASLLVALTIAVVSFSAVRGSKLVRVPLGLAGAAAFYLLVFPQIKPFVFPLYSFTGYVVREDGRSVEGADVEIEDTGLHSKTNSEGRFTISNIPSRITITHLVVISRGGQTHIVEAKNYPGRIFRIPIDPRVKSSVYHISSNEWREGSHAECISTDEKRFLHPAQFWLNKPIQNEEDYSDLLLRVWYDDDDVEIIEARMQQPAKGRWVTDVYGDSKARKWQMPAEGRTTTISLYICLGSNRKQSSFSKSKLQSVYWFEKVE